MKALIMASILCGSIVVLVASSQSAMQKADNLNLPGRTYAKLWGGKAWYPKMYDRLPREGCVLGTRDFICEEQ